MTVEHRPGSPRLRAEGPGRRRRARWRRSGATRPLRWSSTRSRSPACARASCASSATTSPTYDAAGVQVLAVSCDTDPPQKQWAEQQGYTFPVLSDFWPHGEVAKAYGVFNDALGCANRATFLIDTDGNVVDTFATDSLGTAREKARYDEALAKLWPRSTAASAARRRCQGRSRRHAGGAEAARRRSTRAARIGPASMVRRPATARSPGRRLRRCAARPSGAAAGAPGDRRRVGAARRPGRSSSVAPRGPHGRGRASSSPAP